MNRKVITTADGSTTIHIEEWNENYHSVHGAIQEAYHVFIKHGLDLFDNATAVNVLEIGFGTGLNAFITLLEAKEKGLHINYDGVEAYPIAATEMAALNYVKELKADESSTLFTVMHNSDWEVNVPVAPYFNLKKRQQFFSDIDDTEKFNLIYFDAFGARVQPELWTEDIFRRMYNALQYNGVLVTYAAKSSVRRAMLAVGFQVEKLPGPPGKREMLRAFKK